MTVWTFNIHILVCREVTKKLRKHTKRNCKQYKNKSSERSLQNKVFHKNLLCYNHVYQTDKKSLFSKFITTNSPLNNLGHKFKLISIHFRGVIRDFFMQAKPMGGHNLPFLVEIGFMYMKI